VEQRVKKAYSWHDPSLYVLLIMPLIYVIVVMFARRRVKLEIPLCAPHKSQRSSRIGLATGLLLGCVPVPVVMPYLFQADWVVAVAVLLGCGMFVAGGFIAQSTTLLEIREISETHAKFTGASQSFLATVPQIP